MEVSKEANSKALRKKAVYLLPNLFTSASLFSAFLSIIFSIEEHFSYAVVCIFASAFMDGLDGKVARLTNSESEFGVQYDSLSDLIAFGMAPALLVWKWQLHTFDRFGTGIAFLILACAALRLARFNVSSSLHAQKRFFIGLPSPAAGLMIASFVLFATHLPQQDIHYLPVFATLLSLLVALLMVSRVRYFSFKEFDWGRKHPFKTLVIALITFITLFSMPSILLFPFGFCYVLSGIIYTFVYAPYKNRKNRRSAVSQN